VLAKNLTLPERKKLDLARALGVSPELLLVDEIVPGLTPTEVANVIELIKRIRDVYGTTVIMVEHVMRVVMSVSEWIFVLNHGEKIAEGAPREITRNELVVKAYLGDKTKNINR
jgi:branched-chain amino acid transport system ATP-binding protein